MKILKTLTDRLGLTQHGVEKRNGLYVARPVLNSALWAKWAEDAGIPNPVPAEGLHVSVLYSVTDVKMKPDTLPFSVYTLRAYIATMGAGDKALAVFFDSWRLWDRNWDFVNAGAMEQFAFYRPHLTLSYDAAGFEISDEALKSMPDVILLGGEVYAGLGETITDFTSEIEPGEAAQATEVVMSAAAKALESPDLHLAQQYALADIARHGKIQPGAEDVLGVELAKSVLGVDKTESPAAGGDPKVVEKELTLTVQQLPAEMRKSVAAADLFKSNEEERLVWGWASVSTVKGELVVDLQGDTITVKAQREFLHDLMRGQRAGKFDHTGEAVNEIVEGIILDAPLQKALGIDLGMEGMLVVTHVPGDADWEMVKSGKWMYSIAGTVFVEE